MLPSKSSLVITGVVQERDVLEPVLISSLTNFAVGARSQAILLVGVKSSERDVGYDEQALIRRANSGRLRATLIRNSMRNY